PGQPYNFPTRRSSDLTWTKRRWTKTTTPGNRSQGSSVSRGCERGLFGSDDGHLELRDDFGMDANADARLTESLDRLVQRDAPTRSEEHTSELQSLRHL